MEQQVSNSLFNGDPESRNPSNTSESGDFFEALDQSVNSGILDDVQTTPSKQKADNKADMGPGKDILEDSEADTLSTLMADGLRKRYSDSSKEAKRLNSRLKELEPYLPILDAMREDPELISHVRGYFEGGGQAPVSMKEKLGLDDDFMFDPNDAMQDPESQSAQVLEATVNGIVSRRLSESFNSQKVESKRLNDEASFRTQNGMSQEDWDEFVLFAKDKKLELKDIYYLMNKDSREKNIAKSAGDEVSNQMRKSQQRPRSLASSGSAPQQDKSAEDNVFDAILGLDSELDKAFSL